MLTTRLMCFGIALYVGGSAFAQSPLERGRYLVNSILFCAACHTPRGTDGAFDSSKEFGGGGAQTWEQSTYKVQAANITPDPESGLGRWSAADIKRVLVTGIRPNGTKLAPVMPYGFYKIMTANDLDAVVSYMSSLPAVKNTVFEPIYRGKMDAPSPPGVSGSVSESSLEDPLRRGFYLATLGHCMECHSPILDGRVDFKQLGRGGQLFKGAYGVSVSRNITSDRVAGLGRWSDVQIKSAITQGLHIDGTKLKPPMAYAFLARMSDGDLNALVAYLRTVPPQP